MQQRGRQNYNRPAQIKQRESSVTVRSDWIVIEEMEKTQLGKLSLPTVADPDDLYTCGALEHYEKAYDRINVKNEKPLKRIDRVRYGGLTPREGVARGVSV